MTLRVLGVDPGLTRCGIGVVDVEPNRKARLVHVSVIRTHPELELEKRLLEIGAGLEALSPSTGLTPWPWSGCSPSRT